MNIRDLHYLVAVADLGHFGKAAERCHISQPTLSMQIKKLEDTLGVILFERTNKQVMITQAGIQIVARARGILQSVTDIQDIAKAAHSPFAGEFRLGAFPTLAPYFLPGVVPVIHKRLPELRLLLVEEKTGELLKQLKEGRLDAALIALPVGDEAFENRVIMEDPFLLAVSREHPLAKRKTVSQKDIVREQLLLLEEGHCLREQALEVCSVMGAGELDTFRATSLETLRQMVASGIGITLIPRMGQRQGDGLAYLQFEGSPPARTIALVWRKTTVRSKCISALADIMQERSAP